jgi:hypothetical protein
MNTRFKKIINAVISFSFIGMLLLFSIFSIIAPDEEISYSERRKLARFPEFSVYKLYNNNSEGKSYFDELEEYLLDHFVARDKFRTINSFFRLSLLGQKDIDGIYIMNNSIYKMEYKLNEKAVERAADIYLKVIDRYFKDNGATIYYTIVPDKNYYSAKAGGYLSFDYDKLFSIMNDKLENYSFIDIRNELSAEDYYRTDLHWKQENILDVADKLLFAMSEAGSATVEEYEYKIYSGFKGAYYGQAALPIEQDTLVYLTNDTLRSCIVFDYESVKYISLYAEEKLGSVDTYDVFLHGPKSIITIENPESANPKELVIFRDSFGSSIAPLLAGAYSKITLIDIRYVSSLNLGRFIEFSRGCDVLFMYNTGTLNTIGQGSIS